MPKRKKLPRTRSVLTPLPKRKKFSAVTDKPYEILEIAQVLDWLFTDKR